MSKNLKRVLLASVGTIAFAGAGGFERKRSRGINTAIAQLLLFTTLLFITSVATAAAGMRWNQFVTMTDGDAWSWTDNAGSSFNLSFLPGGDPRLFGTHPLRRTKATLIY